jgi:hypothetical protein
VQRIRRRVPPVAFRSHAHASLEKPTPKTGAKTKLTPESIAWAKATARKAGRRYPNLIDNMAAARRQLEAEPRRHPRGDHP